MNARILLVDDEEIVIRSCQRILGEFSDQRIGTGVCGVSQLAPLQPVPAAIEQPPK